MTATGAGEAWAALAVWAAVFAGMLAAPVLAFRHPQRPEAKGRDVRETVRAIDRLRSG